MAVLREYDDEEDLPAFALMSPESFKLWLAILVPLRRFRPRRPQVRPRGTRKDKVAETQLSYLSIGGRLLCQVGTTEAPFAFHTNGQTITASSDPVRGQSRAPSLHYQGAAAMQSRRGASRVFGSNVYSSARQCSCCLVVPMHIHTVVVQQTLAHLCDSCYARYNSAGLTPVILKNYDSEYAK